MEANATSNAPFPADLMNCNRDYAQNLSDVIKAAQQAGTAVSIEKTPEGSESLLQIIYSV